MLAGRASRGIDDEGVLLEGSHAVLLVRSALLVEGDEVLDVGVALSELSLEVLDKTVDTTLFRVINTRLQAVSQALVGFRVGVVVGVEDVDLSELWHCAGFRLEAPDALIHPAVDHHGGVEAVDHVAGLGLFVSQRRA